MVLASSVLRRCCICDVRLVLDLVTYNHSPERPCTKRSISQPRFPASTTRVNVQSRRAPWSSIHPRRTSIVSRVVSSVGPCSEPRPHVALHCTPSAPPHYTLSIYDNKQRSRSRPRYIDLSHETLISQRAACGTLAPGLTASLILTMITRS